MNPSIPVVKVTNHTDSYRIRCPDCKKGTGDSVDHHGMRSKLFIDRVMNSCIEFFNIFFIKPNCILICIFDKGCIFLSKSHFIFVFLRDFSTYKTCKIACFIYHFHFIFFASGLNNNTHSFRTRLEGLKKYTLPSYMRPQYLMGLVLLRINNAFNPWPVHQLI